MPVILRYLLRMGPTNPIAVRLVQNGSRRTKHMYIRSAYLAVLIVVLLWSLLLATSGGNLTYQKLAQAGAQSFTYIAYLQITLICILAPVFMGGAIAQEAGPKTWEVLLTTPLTAGQIVLGNLFGRLLFVLALLFCSLPLFALTQYFGGVPGSAIFASYFVAAGAALLVGAIAIGLAVSRTAGKRAFFAFYVSVVSYLGITIAIDLALRNAGKGMGPMGNGVTVMTSLNPFLSLNALLNPTTYPRASEGAYTGLLRWMLEKPVTTWVAGSAIISVLFMVASTITVRVGGLQMIGAGEDSIPLHRKLLRLTPGSAGAHRAPRNVWGNPIAWREAASRNSTPAKIAARWTFLTLGVLFGAALVVFYHVGTFTHAEFRFAIAATLSVELIVITLVAINTSATAISKEREEGHLDLLLTTPITASAYLWGKLRGLIAYLLPLLAVPIGTLLLACGYVFVNGFGREGGVEVTTNDGTFPVIMPESGLFAAFAIIPFMAACVMVGLQFSLGSKGTLGSTVKTVAVVGILGGVVGLCAYQSITTIAFIGPILGGMSPASFIFGSVYPDDAMSSTSNQAGQASGRVLFGIGALVGTILYALICYGLHSNMVRTFDVTVRKLAGTN